MVRLAVIGIALLLAASAAAAPTDRATIAFVGDLGLLTVGSDGTGVTQLRDGNACPTARWELPRRRGGDLVAGRNPAGGRRRHAALAVRDRRHEPPAAHRRRGQRQDLAGVVARRTPDRVPQP
jgi:hypothetical protein